LPTFSAALCPIRWSSFLFMRRMRENYKNLLKYADALTDIAEVDNLRADLKAFVQQFIGDYKRACKVHPICLEYGKRRYWHRSTSDNMEVARSSVYEVSTISSWDS
jgi:hypothetical protein